ncbi:hypothetical protein [Thermoanaerobacterium thermosaccharolyticum]|uniref:hypothetical protein n=1 Tax=Thermoanaerobacterium thermosaccharolyticum TaxID=1517 RepID=UPI000B960337|nr:hypothetical protein [Thermoanaerobacterium thermosaccharolyticum]
MPGKILEVSSGQIDHLTNTDNGKLILVNSSYQTDIMSDRYKIIGNVKLTLWQFGKYRHLKQLYQLCLLKYFFLITLDFIDIVLFER